MSFDKALSFTLKWEGGYVNDPLDLGGATNAGVTQAVYDRYRLSRGKPKQSVMRLAQEELHQIYLEGYWLAAHCEKMPAPVAAAVFDTAVMRGPVKAVGMLQSVLGVRADGIFGSITLARLQRANPTDTAVRIATARAVFHRERVRQKPNQKRFLNGWLRRANDLAVFVKTL